MEGARERAAPISVSLSTGHLKLVNDHVKKPFEVDECSSSSGYSLVTIFVVLICRPARIHLFYVSGGNLKETKCLQNRRNSPYRKGVSAILAVRGLVRLMLIGESILPHR